MMMSRFWSMTIKIDASVCRSVHGIPIGLFARLARGGNIALFTLQRLLPFIQRIRRLTAEFHPAALHVVGALVRFAPDHLPRLRSRFRGEKHAGSNADPQSEEEIGQLVIVFHY